MDPSDPTEGVRLRPWTLTLSTGEPELVGWARQSRRRTNGLELVSLAAGWVVHTSPSWNDFGDRSIVLPSETPFTCVGRRLVHVRRRWCREGRTRLKARPSSLPLDGAPHRPRQQETVSL